MVKSNSPWYVAGLHFECMQCGRCCAGPTEGYIWVARSEIELIANHLKMTTGEVRRNFLRRVGLRMSIVENHITKDCIFLKVDGNLRKCMIYPVRPTQCRSWPFWSNNLENSDAWSRAAKKCPGVNRGRLYSFEEIEKIKEEKKWWLNPRCKTSSSQK